MNILTQPPAISGAFNPLLLELQQGNETSADITINVDGNTYELSREYLNGKARYNLTELIKSGFKNEQTTVIENIFIDKLLQVEFGSTQTGASFNSTAIRAVSQRRGQYDMTPLCGTFLTGFHELKKYKNYPLFVSFLTFPNTTYINLNGITLNENSFTQKHLTLSVPDGTNTVSITTEALAFALADNLNDPITTNAGVEIVVSTGLLEPENKTTGIDQPCNPVSPFYIRWINRLGGWDCWMFKNRQFQKSELTKTETSYPAIEDYENGPAEAAYTLEAEAKETIIAGEENLTENEFDNLQLLKYAPIIQQYNKDAGEWSRIYIDKADTEKNTGDTRFALEFEFILPLPKLQL